MVVPHPVAPLRPWWRRREPVSQSKAAKMFLAALTTPGSRTPAIACVCQTCRILAQPILQYLRMHCRSVECVYPPVLATARTDILDDIPEIPVLVTGDQHIVFATFK